MRFSMFNRWIPFVFVLFLFMGGTAVLNAAPQSSAQETAVQFKYLKQVSVDLSPFVGEQVQLGFYLSDAEAQQASQIKDIVLAKSAALSETTPTAVPHNSPSQLWIMILVLLPALAMASPPLRQRLPIRSLVIVGTLILLCACLFRFIILPQTHWATEARWRKLDSMTEVTGGQVDVVVPASTYIRGGSLSPNGRWIVWGGGSSRADHQRYLLNVETGEQFDIAYLEEGKRRWITSEYLAFPNNEYFLLHVPDLTVRELEVISATEANEVLKEANDVYVVKGFNSSGSGTGLLSLDPAFPYAVREHVERDEVTLDYTYMPDILEGYEDGIVSPDGTLTAIRTNYPKEGFQSYLEIFHTNTGEIVATAYAEARSPRVMGWGADSRTVYFYEQARALDSDTERPIFKLTIDDPTGMGVPPKSDVASYRRAAQGNPSGWYIDDLLVEEAPATPTPTPTVINTATATSVSTATPPTPTNTPPPPTITPSPTPAPQSWQNQDIGAVLAAGSTVEQSGTFTINGSGDNIWNDDDAFQYAYQPVSGDGTIIARVVSQEDTGDYAKAGIMFRESLDSDSKHAMTSVTPSEGTRLQYRDGDGSSLINNPGYAAPIWLKLERNGVLFTGYRSSDGVTWVEIGQHTVGMGTDIYVGLAVNAFDIDDNGTLSEVVFDNVTIEMSGSSSTPTCDPLPATWVNQDVGSTAAAGTACYSSDDAQFTINGSGDNIWNDDDAFQYAYQTLNGDGSITARVVSQENTGDYAKAGVMFRESLDSNSKHAMTSVTPTEGTRLQYRDGGGSGLINNPGYAAPIWVRLVRDGDTFTGYRSSDGVTWSEIGQHTVTMGTSIHVGLAVTAFDDGALSEVLFDNVVITDD